MSGRIQNLVRNLFALLLLFNATSAMAMNITAIVSDRSAPTLIAGAHQLLEQRQDLTIQIRTVQQISSLSDEELQALISRSDRLLFVAIFGEDVPRLLAMNYPAQQLRTVLHSDRALMPLQRDRHGEIFSQGLPEDILGDKAGVQTAAALAESQKHAPRYADWLQARAYWLNRSVNNAASLLQMLANSSAEYPSLEEVAPLRFALHHGDDGDWLSAAELNAQLKPAQRTVWIIDHDTADLSGDWALHQQLCAAQAWQCVSVLAAWGQPSVTALKAIQTAMRGPLKNSPAAIIALQDFVIGGGEGREAVTAILEELKLPILKGIRISEWSSAQWQLSAE
uniref:cobaltochelatase subunit CobN n=1 Tax=Zhongshania sp. TaxID=1971902 RepID=UPI0035636329